MSPFSSPTKTSKETLMGKLRTKMGLGQQCDVHSGGSRHSLTLISNLIFHLNPTSPTYPLLLPSGSCGLDPTLRFSRLAN